ncbi:hypothetical protein ACFQHO_10805 [Actinomadura yumaensis]|uniref:hypothetical protein n=1 Tax=Actinomadura yumaensis TaxID=111807 RepID=UPI00360EC387
MLVSTVAWGWPELNETSFGRIMKNYGAFYERNSAPGTPYARMFAYLNLIHKASGVCTMVTQIDARLPDAERLLDEYLAAVHEEWAPRCAFSTGGGCRGCIRRRSGRATPRPTTRPASRASRPSTARTSRTGTPPRSTST